MLDENIRKGNVCVTCLEPSTKLSNLLDKVENDELHPNEVGKLFWNFFAIMDDITFDVACKMKICNACENKLHLSAQFMSTGKDSFEKFKEIITIYKEHDEEKELSKKETDEDPIYLIEYLSEHDEASIDCEAEIDFSNDAEKVEQDEEYFLFDVKDDEDETQTIVDESQIENVDARVAVVPRKIRSTIRYNCEKCDKRFVNVELFEAHMNKHNGLPGFTCELCGKTFNIKFRYEVHLRQHNNIKPHICYVCGKGCSTAADLRIHLRMHFNIRDFICKICDKAFHTSSNLKKHTRVHTKERPFVCTTCNNSFTDSSTLKVHIATIHLKLHAYACDQCGRKFKRKHHLKTHGRVHERNRYSSAERLSMMNPGTPDNYESENDSLEVSVT